MVENAVGGAPSISPVGSYRRRFFKRHLFIRICFLLSVGISNDVIRFPLAFLVLPSTVAEHHSGIEACHQTLSQQDWRKAARYMNELKWCIFFVWLEYRLDVPCQAKNQLLRCRCNRVHRAMIVDTHEWNESSTFDCCPPCLKFIATSSTRMNTANCNVLVA